MIIVDCKIIAENACFISVCVVFLTYSLLDFVERSLDMYRVSVVSAYWNVSVLCHHKPLLPPSLSA